MAGFWAFTLLGFGLFLAYPGIFIWPFGLLSLASVAGAMAVMLWDNERRHRVGPQLFAWTCGFILVLEAGL